VLYVCACREQVRDNHHLRMFIAVLLRVGSKLLQQNLQSMTFESMSRLGAVHRSMVPWWCPCYRPHVFFCVGESIALQTAGYDDKKTTILQFTVATMKRQATEGLELEHSFPFTDVALVARLR
jgi:hypothetical protein